MAVPSLIHARKHLLRFLPMLLLLAALTLWLAALPAQAAVFNPGCNVGNLATNFTTANGNNEADTINLTGGCTYTLTATLAITADNGNLLTINGNGATISGNNLVRVFNIASGANVSFTGITIANGFRGIGDSDGGGILNDGGTVTITNSTLSNNNVVGFGGGILNNGGTVTVTNSTLSNNGANFGSGILNNGGTVTVTNSTLSNNGIAGNSAGGIHNTVGGTVTITHSTLSGNSSADRGGGIRNLGAMTITNSTLSNNGSSEGGGIWNSGTVMVTNSTLASNSSFDGGGIWNSGTVTITNSTLSVNTTPNSTVGGSIHNEGTVTLTNVTITRGDATGFSTIRNDGTLNAANSILNIGCGGAFGINPTGPNFGCITSPMDTLQGLGAFNGQYHPLLPGSPAIDAGDNTICAAAPVNNLDQRGAARPQDGDGDGTATCDLGSYEADAVPVNTPTPTNTPTEMPTGAPTSTPTGTPLPTATVPPPPPTPLCEDHNFAEGGVVRASTRDGLDYAINCRVLYQNGQPTQWLGGDLYNAGAIGIQGVLDLGAQQAVDIFSPVGWAYFDGGAVFCLRGQGTLIWLAASGAPRHAEIIGSYTVDDFPGFTCATLYEPGTLVLVSENPME